MDGPRSADRTFNPVMVAMAFSNFAGHGAPLSEELLMRGFLFSTLQETPVGTAGAAVITSTVWTALHPNVPWYAVASAFIFGLMLVYARVRTGSLWTCILAHAMFNAVPALVPIVYR